LNKLWTWLLVVLLGLAVMGCRFDEAARADVPESNLNEAFTLAGGQDGLIPSEKLRLRLAEVPEDSRRPTQVECVWTGQARIAISVHPQGSGSTNVEFNTNPAPGQTIKVAEVGRYRIELQSLDPTRKRLTTPTRSRITAQRWWCANVGGAQTLVAREFFSGVGLFGHTTDG
jgi:hypothetical protein